jgi:hypothetical protein
MAGISGKVDLRVNNDALHYAALADREYAQYVAATDVGLLLYQDNQRDVMSGVLGDYVWAGASILATEHSYVGAEVNRNVLGLALGRESPRNLATALMKMLHTVRIGANLNTRNAFRESIAPVIVLQKLTDIMSR